MSQPATRTPPQSLNQAEQQQVIQEIGRVILRALPPGWAESTIEYRAAGAHRELAAHLVAPNGTVVPLAPPSEVWELFGRLRAGMYQPDRGTWLSALYRLQRPSSYSVDFNGDYEPVWDTLPTPADLADELRRYPRAAENVPQWLGEAVGTPAPAGPATLRVAEVFDGTDASGRPIVQRPTVPPDERDRVLEYLEQAPIVRTSRGYDMDRLNPEDTPSVPLAMHTDGHWIWPGAVAYYLRRHAVAPEQDLLAHIRRLGFRIPTVDERARELAASLVAGEATAASPTG
jgi:hypothetical protein